MQNAELRNVNGNDETRPTSFSILNSQFSIAFVLTLFVVLCLINNVMLPVFEASDEASHFRYADYLASERRLPDLKRDLPSHEVTQPVLYYALVALAISPFDRSSLDDISHLNPDWFDQTLNADYKSVYPLHIHTAQENWPWSSTVWAVHVGRLVSTLLGALTILFVYKIAKEVMCRQSQVTSHKSSLSAQRLALFAAALVAFNPKFIHMSAIVNNDGAITFAATLACWWMLRLVGGLTTDDRRPTTDVNASSVIDRRWSVVSLLNSPFFMLGALVGFAMLCKLSGIGLLIPATFTTFVAPYRSSVVGRRRSYLIRLAHLAIGFLLITGAWFLFNLINYGNPLAWAQVQAANAALLRVPPLNLSEILMRIPAILESYWGVLSIELHYPMWVNVAFYIGLALALVGCVVGVVGRTSNVKRNADDRQRTMDDNESSIVHRPSSIDYVSRFTFRPQLLILLFWEIALLGSYVLWLRSYVGTENGRLILPGVAPVVILVVMGWMALIPVTLQRIFSLGVVVALFALSLITPWWVIRPAFAPPIFLNTDEVAARTAPNSPVFNGQIKLLRAELGTLTPHSSAGQANAQLPLTLYWGAQQPIDQSYRVEVRVVEADTGNVIGQLRALPNHGRFATNRWPIGQYFRDDYTLVISATQPHIARVELRLFQQYPQPGYVKLINDSDVFLIEHVRVGPLLPHDPAAANAAQAFFGEGIALMASQVNTDTLELSWRCRDAPHNDYTLFVHVFDANNNVLAQYDGQPQQGEAPTSLWMPNDVYADRRPISLPPNAARIQIGWYDPATGARLPATHPDGSRWPDDAVVIWERKP